MQTSQNSKDKKPKGRPKRNVEDQGVENLVSKCWSFTWNNFPADYRDQFTNNTFLKERMIYFVSGEEVAPDTGTPHLQGYIKLKASTTLFKMRLMFPGIHFQKSYKNELANSRYCKKDGTNIFELGTLDVKQGRRTDLNDLLESVKRGESMRLMMSRLTATTQIQYVERLMKYYEPPRKWTDDFEFIWIYGPTECGKTRDVLTTMCKREYELGDVYVTMSNGQWWDGYDRHPVVLIDDFRSSFCTFSELLQICQPVEKKIQIKGSARQLVANKIIVTTCKSPLEVYQGVDENRDQLYRRITKVMRYTKEGVVDETLDMKTIVSHIRLKSQRENNTNCISLMDQYKNTIIDEESDILIHEERKRQQVRDSMVPKGFVVNEETQNKLREYDRQFRDIQEGVAASVIDSRLACARADAIIEDSSSTRKKIKKSMFKKKLVLDSPVDFFKD